MPRHAAAARTLMTLTVTALTLAVLATPHAAAQSAADRPAPASEAPKIRDNLFLLEEAYNQEPGVVQHIQSAVWSTRAGGFDYSFTDEWPVPGDRHQLSLTVPVARAVGSPTTLGDVLVNYRLQAVGAGGAGTLAIAPRVSLILPTEPGTDPGRGVMGMQFNVPVSIELGRSLVTHLNAGFTVTPGIQAVTGRRTLVDTNVGAALVWLAAPRANAVLEVLHASSQELRPDGTSARNGEFILNPGVRFAINFRSGLQVVPGLSIPVRFPASSGRAGVLAYLSLEHPLWSPGR